MKFKPTWIKCGRWLSGPYWYDSFCILSNLKSHGYIDPFVGEQLTVKIEFKQFKNRAENAHSFFDAVVVGSSESQGDMAHDNYLLFDRLSSMKLNRMAAVAHLLNIRLALLSRGKVCKTESVQHQTKHFFNTWRDLADHNIYMHLWRGVYSESTKSTHPL